MKYIIDIPEDAKYGILTCKVDRGMGYYTKDIDLTEAEQLTAGYINEHFGSLQQDAYYQGYKDGRNVTETQAHDDAYQRGLNDAWEAARKIADMWTRIDNDELLAIFGITERIGHSTIRSMFEKQTANEAMLELEAYEEKQQADNCIEIGDEVEWDGSVADHIKKSSFVKTGNHYDISSILNEMQSQ